MLATVFVQVENGQPSLGWFPAGVSFVAKQTCNDGLKH
jgi:hypothetical protein